MRKKDFTFAQKQKAMKYDFEKEEKPCRCLQCGTVIDYGGRHDRKFCSAGCKNRYHNYRRYRRSDLSQRGVLGKLSRNHEILEKLVRMDVKTLDRITLMFMGFDPAFSTSCCRIGRHTIYTCFDIRYELTPSRIKRILPIMDDLPTSE